MANGNPINASVAPMFAFQQQMDERDRNRQRFPLEQAAAKSQINRRRALTDLTEAKTERNRQSLDVDLDTKRQKLANMQLEHDIAKEGKNFKKLNRKYAINGAAGHSMLSHLEKGNTEAANEVLKQYVQDYEEAIGEKPPIADKISKGGGVTEKDVPAITAMTDISIRNAEQIREAMASERDFGEAASLERIKGEEQRKGIRTKGKEARKTEQASGDGIYDALESDEEFREGSRQVITNSIATKTGAQVTSDGQVVIDEDGPKNAVQDTQAFAEELTEVSSQLRGVVESPESVVSNFAQQNFDYGEFMIEDKWGPDNIEISGFYPRSLGTKEEVQGYLKEQIANVEAQNNISLSDSQKSQYAGQLLQAMKQEQIKQLVDSFTNRGGNI